MATVLESIFVPRIHLRSSNPSSFLAPPPPPFSLRSPPSPLPPLSLPYRAAALRSLTAVASRSGRRLIGLLALSDLSATVHLLLDSLLAAVDSSSARLRTPPSKYPLCLMHHGSHLFSTLTCPFWLNSGPHGVDHVV